MEYIKYLRSIITEGNGEWTIKLNEIIKSNSLQIGTPYDERVKLLLIKFKKRRVNYSSSGSDVFGLSELIKRLSLYSEDEMVKVFPLKNDSFSGDCIIYNSKIIGCAFIRRGRSSSKEGLWVDGNKIE